MFLVFNHHCSLSSIKEIAAHAESVEDVDLVRMVATNKLIVTCACAVLIEVTRAHFAA